MEILNFSLLVVFWFDLQKTDGILLVNKGFDEEGEQFFERFGYYRERGKKFSLAEKSSKVQK